MKKKLLLVIVAVVVLCALFVPIPKGPYKDGGSREYCALTYKVVDWNRLSAEDVYDETRIYWFPNNFKSIDTLWEREAQDTVCKFTATVVELTDTTALVQPVEAEDALHSSDRISIGLDDLEDIGAQVGSDVVIYYTGGIMETYPAKVHATKWEIAKDLRHKTYTDQWLDKETAEKCENDIFDHIVITEIYANCFFAQNVIPLPNTIKLNGTLSEDWCVGDQVVCTYENTYYDQENHRIEADLLTVKASDWEPDPYACYKPVIYLYPKEETQVSVKLSPSGKLTCTYPDYGDGWQVTAAPDGTLTDHTGQTYNYLYWEGETDARWDMEEGFCVKGSDTAAFLEDALEKLGLSRREANEFIVYWLPLMEQNPYNIISFQTDAYQEAVPLQVTPAPDTVIRVFMTYRAAEDYEEIPAQVLTAPQRQGFSVIEWGGTQVK